MNEFILLVILLLYLILELKTTLQVTQFATYFIGLIIGVESLMDFSIPYSPYFQLLFIVILTCVFLECRVAEYIDNRSNSNEG